MSGVEFLVVFAVVIGFAGLFWLYVKANNSEYETKTDSVEDSP